MNESELLSVQEELAVHLDFLYGQQRQLQIRLLDTLYGRLTVAIRQGRPTAAITADHEAAVLQLARLDANHLRLRRTLEGMV